MEIASNGRSNPLKDLLRQIDDELSIGDSSQISSPEHTTSEVFGAEPHKEHKLYGGFSLYINQNETQALLKYIPTSPPSLPDCKAMDLIELIKGLGYTYGLLEKNIQKALNIVRENPKAEIDVIAAVGREPKAGHPGEIEYWIGNEDYNKQSGTIQTRKNDLLLRVSPPKPGIPGIQITGAKINPPPSKIIGIIPGDHVYKTQEGEYYTDCAGTVVLKDRILSVHEVNRDASATVTVSEDKMQALITIDPPLGSGKPIALGQVQALLGQAGVLAGIQNKAIEQVLLQANEKRQRVNNAIVAQGTPPTIGRDASIAWYVNPKLLRDRFIINEDGSVDFYNQNNILTVTEGDRLLTIHPAREGRNGVNVLGEVLPGKSGKPIAIQLGPNIVTRKEDTEWYAACTGLYRLHHNILEVQPMFFVKGDVDFSIGNIDFNGDVIIAGNVLDGFEVRAQGCISVIGTVEAAILEAGKCIEVKNGIFGKEKGKISAGNDVVSFFLQNADVSAGRDVIIGNQILNSRVYARRNVEVRCGKGILVGGLTVAGFGIKAKIIGSDYGVRTILEVGSDFAILDKLMNVSQKEKALLAKSEQLESAIEQEMRKRDFVDNDNINLLVDARQKQDTLRQTIASLRAEYQLLATELYVTNNPQIATTDTIMPDVYVRMRDARYKFQSPVKKALVGLDEKTRKITVSSRGA